MCCLEYLKGLIRCGVRAGGIKNGGGGRGCEGGGGQEKGEGEKTLNGLDL